MTTLEATKPAPFKHPFCEKCEEGRSGAFCWCCGTRLVEGRVLCECGYDNIWSHEKFCQKCGKKVER